MPLPQRRFGAFAAAFLVAPIWAVWHLPFFFSVSGYRGFAPFAYVGFVFGLACGSVVLTWLYNGPGGSILACAIWHGLYNVDTGTAASTSLIQAITTMFVYVLAFVLVGLELRARRRGEASVLGPRAGSVVETEALRSQTVARDLPHGEPRTYENAPPLGDSTLRRPVDLGRGVARLGG